MRPESFENELRRILDLVYIQGTRHSGYQDKDTMEVEQAIVEIKKLLRENK